MSDFEWLTALNQTFEFVITAFSIFLSIIFAFLVASSLLANRLSRRLAWIAVGLFTGACAVFITLVFNVSTNVGETAEQIKAAVASGESGLGWLTFVERDAPLWLLPYLFSPLMTLGYLASVVFFFQQRRTLRARTDEPA